MFKFEDEPIIFQVESGTEDHFEAILPKMQILSLFIHSHVISIPYLSIFCGTQISNSKKDKENKKKYHKSSEA